MGSHTATGEWQSFELRMRRRRAERLLLRADVALDAGFADDARACMEEARRLAPALPEIAALQVRLDAPAAAISSLSSEPGGPVVSALRRNTGLVLFGAGVAAIVTMMSVVYRSSAIAPAHDFRTASVVPALRSQSHPAAEMATPPKAADAAPPPAMEDIARQDATVEPLTSSPARVEEVVDTSLPKAVAAEETPDDFVAALPPQPVPTSLASALPPARNETPAVDAAVDRSPRESGATVPVHEGLASAPGASVAASAPAAGVADPTGAILGVLDRYAAAYNVLDAAAAQRVWPAVNVGALARAFDGLASQRLSLGSCRIDAGGATAQADCDGSATWTAKIGDQSPHIEARRWSFELARAGDDWHIISARVQNR